MRLISQSPLKQITKSPLWMLCMTLEELFVSVSDGGPPNAMGKALPKGHTFSTSCYRSPGSLKICFRGSGGPFRAVGYTPREISVTLKLSGNSCFGYCLLWAALVIAAHSYSGEEVLFTWYQHLSANSGKSWDHMRAGKGCVKQAATGWVAQTSFFLSCCWWTKCSVYSNPTYLLQPRPPL